MHEASRARETGKSQGRCKREFRKKFKDDATCTRRLHSAIFPPDFIIVSIVRMKRTSSRARASMSSGESNEMVKNVGFRVEFAKASAEESPTSPRERRAALFLGGTGFLSPG